MSVLRAHGSATCYRCDTLRIRKKMSKHKPRWPDAGIAVEICGTAYSLRFELTLLLFVALLPAEIVCSMSIIKHHKSVKVDKGMEIK